MLTSFKLPALLLLAASFAQAQTHISTDRGEATVLIEPYAPNIVRVSLSLLKPDALAPPGYGISAQPAPAGWSTSTGERGDILQSSALTVTLAPRPKGPGGPLPETAKFFSHSNS